MRLRQLFVLSTLSVFAASGQAVITAVAGDSLSQSCGYSGDGGPASQALLCNAQAPVADSFNNLYFIDANNHVIRKITPGGIISTIAGTGVQGTSGDDGPALSAQIGAAGQLAYDGIGYVCFGDQTAHKIRCVSLVSGLMRGIGTGVNGYSGDGGSIGNAAFGQITSLVFIPRSAGISVFADTYIADLFNNVVRKFDGFTGVITTIAGNGTRATSGDGGPARAASLNGPGALALGNSTLYITEVAGSRVRAVNLNTGIITTVAGTGASTYTGDGGPAIAAGLSIPLSVAVDDGGNLFISDFSSHIRKVDPAGIITTYAGGNNNGSSGPDNVVPSLTSFSNLGGMTWNSQANQLLLGDLNRIRQVSYQGSTTQVAVTPTAYSAGAAVTLNATVQPAAATGSVSFFYNYDYLGTSTLAGGQAAFSTTATASGGTYWAIYHGDSTYASSHSPGPQLQFPFAIRLYSSANPTPINQAVTLSASLSQPTATGTVQFFVNSVPAGSSSLFSGTASVQTSFNAFGTYNITAAYSGDSNNPPVNSGTVAQVIANNPTTTVLFDISGPTLVNQSVTIGVTPTPVTPGITLTGTAQLYANGVAVGAPQAITTYGNVAITTPPLTTAGNYSFTATYSGDSNYSPSTSNALIHVVKRSPNLTFTSSLNPAASNQSVTYTVTTDAAATGNVNISRFPDFSVSVPLVNGRATYTTSNQTANSGFASASYAGDATFGSVFASFQQVVTFPQANIVLTSSLNPTVAGTPVTFTATATAPQTPTGAIQFLDGATVLGTVTLTGGVATITVPSLVVGTHSITAVYSGDTYNGGATSAPLTETIRAATSITLASGANPSILGNSVTITATITPSTATGLISLSDGTAFAGSAFIANGTATFTFASPSVGTHSITANYSGDASNAGSSAPPLAQVVNKIPTTAVVNSNANPANAGTSVGLTATITPATATGTVQFLDGTTVLATFTIIGGGAATFSTSTLVVGTHSITAVYSGDASTASSTSAALSQVINKATTTTTLTSSANPANSGASVGYTASVVPATATGTIQFLDGATVLGTATISGGSATLNTATLNPGTHSITAVYSGDASNATSTSGAISQVINKATTTTTVASSANPANSGASVGLTASVVPATATGTIQFLDGATILGTATISSGTATLNAALTPGTHSITAVYSGDASNATSTSAALAQVINKAPTTTAITSNANPANSGTSVGLTAAVAPATATGTIQFLDGATVLGTATISGGGSATLSLTTLAAGTHPITAVYSGDASNATSTSAALTQVINLAATITTLGSNATTAAYGAPVGLTATVSPATATGTMQFLDGATILGSATITAGSATLTISTLAVGTHTITVVYSGDPSNATSTSAPLAQIIAKIATGTALSSGWNPAVIGYTFTLTAVVAPASATGTVQFLEGTTVLGSATLASGSASLIIPTLPVGTHNLVAVYSGDAVNGASISAVFVQVTKSIPAVFVTSNLNPSQVGQAVNFTVTMNVNATGTVQFLDNDTLFGTATLSGGACSVSTSALTQGTHTISMFYSGDATYMSASGGGVIQSVKPKPVATTTVVTSSQNPTLYSTMVTLTAAVTPASATGTIQFMDGANPIATVPVTSGTATFSFGSLSVGTHSIIAIYNGDLNNLASSSAALAQVVNKVTTTTALASTANPSTAGGSIILTADVTPAAVIVANGNVQFLDGATVLGTGTLSSGGTRLTIASLAAGTHNLTAVYSGDANSVASTSPALVQVVNKAATTAAVTSSLNPSVTGNSVTLTAAMTPATATGTVQFLDGSTVLGTGTLASGGATLATATLAAGTHNITVVYSGDGNNLASTSSALAQVVNKAATAAVVTSSLNPSLAGNTVTFTAAVTPATATGTVQFLDGAAVLGTGTLASGAAAVATATLAAGTHNITVVYSGDANNLASTSSALAQVVNKAATAAVVTSSLNPSLAGNTVTFTAAVMPATATGTVQFLDGSTVLGAATLASGRAALATAAFVVGTHNLTVVYSGDANNAASTSSALAQVVSKAATSTVVTSSLNPSVVGNSVTFTATLTPATATGAIQFLDGSTVLGTATLASGRATLTTAALASSTHAISATYSGDTSNLGSTSAALTQSVSPSAPSSLSASAASSRQINLSWTASATTGVTYNVYMSTTSGFTPSAANKIASGLTSTTYASTGLTAATAYYFKVSASNAGGESPATAQATATTTSALSCHVVYNITSRNSTTFSSSFNIQNSGTSAISNWTLTWAWQGNQTLTSASNATFSQTGVNATLTHTSGNGTIGAGSTLNGVGINAHYSGANSNPAAFYVNGTLCH